MKKYTIAAHRNLGLPLSIVMLCISVSGTLLLWKKEYLFLDLVEARQNIDLNFLASAVATIDDFYPADELLYVQLYSEGLSIHKAFLTERRYAWHDQKGRHIQTWSQNQRFEDWLLDFHHRFLLGNKIGLQIAGIGGLLLMLLLPLGLIIWWPRRSTFKLGFRMTSLHRGVLMRSHGSLGVLMCFPILVLVATGVILVYPTESRWLLLESTGTHSPTKLIEEPYEASNGLPEWGAMIESAYTRFPGSKIRSITPASSSYPSRTVAFQQQHSWVRIGRSSMKYQADGRLIINDELQQNKAKRLFELSYPIHASKLGWAFKIFLTLVGLCFTAICLMGLVSYVQGRSMRST